MQSMSLSAARRIPPQAASRAASSQPRASDLYAVRLKTALLHAAATEPQARVFGLRLNTVTSSASRQIRSSPEAKPPPEAGHCSFWLMKKPPSARLSRY